MDSKLQETTSYQPAVTGHLHFWTVTAPRKCWFEYHIDMGDDRFTVGAFGDYRLQAARNAGERVFEQYSIKPPMPRWEI